MFEKVFIIAEAGSNHNGDLGTAVELVHRAKEAGADAIKFQDFSLHLLVSIDYYGKTLGLDNSWQKGIISNTFRQEWHKTIALEAEKTNIIYFSTPFSLEAVDLLDEFVPFYKIASCDITFYPLLKKAASKGKGIFISTGASYIEEIDKAVQILKQYELPFICIMHCVMLYPASYSSLNLSFIDLLTERYNLPVGFSDHSPGIDAALLSIGKGVKVIEKHFTLNRDQDGNDHKNSLSPEGFKELVNKTRLYEKMLGKRQKIISERESKERIYARRGIYAGRNLKKGERLTLDKLAFLRPNISNGVEKLDDLLDNILNTDIQKGAPINSSMVK
ncbi:MAG: N-acetylneuraminate synthase family protein [Spirochaetes bacterium]|nr:N-acetylneuraminate synthase family protein [Spirochaetota bacterium]